MGKTWKDQRRVRNHEAKELWTQKYRKRVIPDKREKATEAEVLNGIDELLKDKDWVRRALRRMSK